MMNEIYYMNTSPDYQHWKIVLLTWTSVLFFLVMPGLAEGVGIWWKEHIAAARKPATPIVPMPARLHHGRAA